MKATKKTPAFAGVFFSGPTKFQKNFVGIIPPAFAGVFFSGPTKFQKNFVGIIPPATAGVFCLCFYYLLFCTISFVALVKNSLICFCASILSCAACVFCCCLFFAAPIRRLTPSSEDIAANCL